MSWLWIKNFPSLLASLFISKVGDYAYEVVFVFIVLEVTENNYLFTGLVYFFRFIPFLFFGPVGGWMADNGRLRRNLLFSEWVRLFVSFLLFLTYLSGRADIFILIIASVVTTIGRALFQPSFQTAVPQIVADKDLARANSITHVAEETASIIGPLICSLILLVADKAWVLVFNGLTYFISILFLITIRDFQQQSSVSFRFRQVYRETYSSVQQMYYLSYGLFVAIVGSALCILFTGSVLRFIIPAVAVISGEGEIFTSLLFSLMAAGTIIGGFVYAWFIKRRSPQKLMWLWFLYGFLMLTMSVSTFFSLYFLLPLSFLLGICGAWVDITLVTIIQSHSQKENIGKNFGAFSTFANSAEAISGLVSGGLAAIGLIVSFIVMTSLIVFTGLTGVLLLSRNTGKVQRERAERLEE